MIFKQDSQILSELGSRVRALRLSFRYSQVELADKADVGKTTVQRLENSGQVSLDSLLKILRVLGAHEAIENIAPALDFDPQAAFEDRQKNQLKMPMRKRVSRKRRTP
ncbi:MAG: transcriptional regulator with XRE-family HTH domain [Lysobacterales bacterium]|jgi:transcriptional regulator with XRE-family HTH domain